MIKDASYSFLIQVVASASNFAVALILMRFVTLDQFGAYVYVVLFGAFAANFSIRLLGQVYHYCLPKLAALRNSYVRAYNGFALLVVLGVAAAAFAVYALAPYRADGLFEGAVFLQILGSTAVENFKLQGTADGRYRGVFLIEVARSVTVILAALALAILSRISVGAVVFTQGAASLAAAAALLMIIRWSVSFRRLGWVARRHWTYGRQLIPAQLVGTLHFTGLQFLALASFGTAGLGTLRAAELPFGMLQPVKQSLIHFMPRTIHGWERTGYGARAMTSVVAGVSALAVLFSAAALVAGIAFTEPLTNKVYPVHLAIAYAAGSAVMMVAEFSSVYLTAIAKQGTVFSLSCLGAATALGSYLALFSFIGLLAVPMALLISFFAIVVCSFVVLGRHADERLRSFAGACQDPSLQRL